MLTNSTSLNGDNKRVALAGESASANLALATAIAVRDASLQVLTHVLAVYPVGQIGNFDTASYKGSSRISVGSNTRRPDVELAAEQQDPDSIVGKGTEAQSVGLDRLDVRVQAVSGSVRDAVLGVVGQPLSAPTEN